MNKKILKLNFFFIFTCFWSNPISTRVAKNIFLSDILSDYLNK